MKHNDIVNQVLSLIRSGNMMDAARKSGYHYQTIAKLRPENTCSKLSTVLDLAGTVDYTLVLVPLHREKEILNLLENVYACTRGREESNKGVGQ